MIRLCDKNVYNAELSKYGIDECFNFFINDHKNDIICFYSDNGELYGTLSYADLCEKNDLEKAICTVKIRFKEDMWDEIHNYLRENNMHFLPLYNSNGELQSFCYDDVRENWDYTCIDRTINQIRERPDFAINVFKAMFPEINIFCLYDMNEWSFILYKALLKMNFPVITKGRNWNILSNNDDKYNINEYADFSIFNIYAEGSESIKRENSYPMFPFPSVVNYFLVLKQIGEISTVYQKSLMIKSLVNKDAQVFYCRVPERDELNVFVGAEKQEYIAAVNNCRERLIQDEEVIDDYSKQLFFSIYSEEDCRYLIKYGKYTEFNELPVFLNNDFKGRIISEEYNNKLKNRIYLIGACITTGHWVRRNESLQYFLQENLKDYVVVCVVYNEVDYIKIEKIVQDLPVRKNDIVLFIDDLPYWNYDKRCKIIELKDIYNNPLRKEVLFSNEPIHSNAKGNKVIADRITENILGVNLQEKDSRENSYLQIGEILDKNSRLEVQRYVDSIKETNIIGINNGAIVMNANPFTNGHLYLIEKAADKVDTLFVFVVEEDKSNYKFEDRYRLVKEQVTQFKNVVVIPSGKFVLSYMTFPVYFEKADRQNEEVDASSDIEIFARYIAPKLNIKYRFVGQEPLDKVTNQYNIQMKYMLREWNIDLVDIPRCKVDDEVISASKVRKMVKSEQWDVLKKFVPERTYHFLLEKKKI